MSQPAPLEQFGKYQILERIARGGMAEIFKARMEGVGGFNRLFAIKRILPGLSQNREYVDLLVDEAKIAGLLTHANIVQILDLGQVEGQYYVAMEYVHGRDLGAVLERCRERGITLPVPHAVFLAIEVLKGLEYAHKRQIMRGNRPVPLNIVHRDVSPSNVLVSFQGEVKLTDFGIAKANVKALETLSGVIKGKFDYMSPEQASGEPVDQRTDLFAAGVLLFEMLCGAHPFRQKGELRTIEAIRKGEYKAPSTVNPDVPYSLEVILDRALARNAADRHPTATEFKEELTRFFHDAGFIFSASTMAAFLKGLFPEAGGAARREGRVLSLREQETRPLPPRRPESDEEDRPTAADSAPPAPRPPAPPRPQVSSSEPSPRPPPRPARFSAPEEDDDGPTAVPHGRPVIGSPRSDMPPVRSSNPPPVEPPARPRSPTGAHPVQALVSPAPAAAPRPRPPSAAHAVPEPPRGRQASGAFSPPEPQVRPPRPPSAVHAIPSAPIAPAPAPPPAPPPPSPVEPSKTSSEVPAGGTRARPIPRRTRDPAPSGFFDPRVFGEEPENFDQDTLLRRVPEDRLRGRNLASGAPAPAAPAPAPAPAPPPVAMLAPRVSLESKIEPRAPRGIKAEPTAPFEKGAITLPGGGDESTLIQKGDIADALARENEWNQEASTLIRPSPLQPAKAAPIRAQVEVEEELELDEASVRAQAIRLPAQTGSGDMVRIAAFAAVVGVCVMSALLIGFAAGVWTGRGPLAPTPPPPVLAPPSLTLELPEGAKVKQDGEALSWKGDTPLSVTLQPGVSSKIQVEAEGGFAWEHTFTLEANDVRTVTLVPLPPPKPTKSR